MPGRSKSITIIASVVTVVLIITPFIFWFVREAQAIESARITCEQRLSKLQEQSENYQSLLSGDAQETTAMSAADVADSSVVTALSSAISAIAPEPADCSAKDLNELEQRTQDLNDQIQWFDDHTDILRNSITAVNDSHQAKLISDSQQQEEQTKQEEERREAEQEAKQKAQQEAKEKAQQEAKQKAQQEAEQRAQQEAKEKAQEEAEQRAEQEAKEKAQQEAEQKAQQEAQRQEEQTKREKERRAAQQAEQQKQQAAQKAEQQEKRQAEKQTHKEAEQQVQQEAKQESKQQAEQKPEQQSAQDTATTPLEESNISRPNLADYPDITVQVDTSAQRVYVQSAGSTIYTMTASTGVNDITPKGDFTVDGRGLHFYNEHEGMGADYWVRFYGNYLFHSVPTGRESGDYLPEEAAKLGQPASHGCVRLSVADAKWFYQQVADGTPVHIY